MEFIKSTVLPILAIPVSLGVLAAGLGYFISMFRRGSKQKDSDLMSTSDQIIQFLKTQNDELKAIIESKDKAAILRDQEWNNKFQALNKEFGEVKGQLKEKNDQNDRLEAIFKDRDPETKDFQKFMMQSVKDQTDAQKEMIRVLGEIHMVVKDEHDKEMLVTATVTKQ